MTTHFRETPFGFEWGAAVVERTMSHHGEVVIAIKSAREEVYVRVTPSGLVRCPTPVKVKRLRKAKP